MRGRLERSLSIVLITAMICSAIICVGLGSAQLSPQTVVTVILHRAHLGTVPPAAWQDHVVWDLRVPRVLLAAIVGYGLALSGSVMQHVTSNPLADPYTLGVSAGATLGALLGLLTPIPLSVPIAAFLGGAGALTMTMVLSAGSGPPTPLRTVLAGVAVSSLISSVSSLLIFLNAAGDAYREVLDWLMGSVAGARWEDVTMAGAASMLLVPIILIVARRYLDTFHFGDRAAQAMGTNVRIVRGVLHLLTSALTAALVSVSGAIGFVGLVLPHLVRRIPGLTLRSELLLAPLAGATLLVWCDTAARTIASPRELPVGIVTALLGAPVLALVLARGSR